MFQADGVCVGPLDQTKFRELEKPREGLCGQSAELEGKSDSCSRAGETEKAAHAVPWGSRGGIWV